MAIVFFISTANRNRFPSSFVTNKNGICLSVIRANQEKLPQQFKGNDCSEAAGENTTITRNIKRSITLIAIQSISNFPQPTPHHTHTHITSVCKYEKKDLTTLQRQTHTHTHKYRLLQCVIMKKDLTTLQRQTHTHTH